MDYDYKITNFSKCVLAGLAVGITGAVLNIIYNTVYREVTEYSFSEIINAYSLTLGTSLLLLLIGMLYYVLDKTMKKGSVVFTALFIVITAICILLTLRNAGSDTINDNGAKGLYLGLEIIMGVLIAFLLPYLAKHPKIYIG